MSLELFKNAAKPSRYEAYILEREKNNKQNAQVKYTWFIKVKQ